jgi:hypothetical protein
MRLGDICDAPCFPRAADFSVPKPGCSADKLKFGDDGRQYFSVLLSNHDRRDLAVSPRLALVGLSPGATQLNEFVSYYAKSGSYTEASMRATFAALAPDIIAMLEGTGLAAKLKLSFPYRNSFARHPDVYVTSLVGCATLDPKDRSDDFDPAAFDGTRRCIEIRFLNEMLNPRFDTLEVVVILGKKGQAAVSVLRGGNDRRSILQVLENAGKTVLFFPHPSGQNIEQVRLASLPLSRVPLRAAYISEKWEEYSSQPPRPGKVKQTESAYKARRGAIWDAVYDLRWEIAGMRVRP